MKLKLKKAIRFLSSHSKNNEWERSINWYASKKQEVLSKFNKSGNVVVNQDEFINDHISGKSDELSDRLMGGF